MSCYLNNSVLLCPRHLVRVGKIIIIIIIIIIIRTSAVSSTNFGSILIFASCVVGPCNILVYYKGFARGRLDAARYARARQGRMQLKTCEGGRKKGPTVWCGQ